MLHVIYKFRFLLYIHSGPYAEILKGGFYFDLVGNPRCGGVGAQPPDADKIEIFQHLKYA